MIYYLIFYAIILTVSGRLDSKSTLTSLPLPLSYSGVKNTLEISFGCHI